jgi:hypothetical protein
MRRRSARTRRAGCSACASAPSRVRVPRPRELRPVSAVSGATRQPNGTGLREVFAMASNEPSPLVVAATSVASFMLPRVSLACSGPLASEHITRNTTAAWVCFSIVAAAGCFSWLYAVRSGYRDRKLVWLPLLVVINPGWWMSSMRGDCGTDRLVGSILASAIGVVLAVKLVRASDGSKQPPSPRGS